MLAAVALPTIPTQPIFEAHQMDEAVRWALEHGFAIFRRPGLRSIISELNASVAAFCALPATEKLPWEIHLPEDIPGEGADSGYLPKGSYRQQGQLSFSADPAERDKPEDDKELIHWRPWLAKEFKNRARRKLSEIEQRMVTAGSILYAAGREEAGRVARSLDERVLPGFDFVGGLREMDQPRLGHVLRLLYYKEGEQRGGVLAGAHTDRCAITLHIADSRPGLVVFLRNGEQFLVPTIPDTMILFFGKRASVRTQGAIRSLIHRVISPVDGPPITSRRTCQVLFVNTPDDFKKFDNKHWTYL